MPAVGFDISDRSIKYVELGKRHGAIFVKRFGEHLIPEGVIEAGEIKQKEKLTDFLKTIKEEEKSAYLIVALPEEKAFLTEIKLPLMEREEIRGALELQLEEHIPLSAEEVIFDFDFIKEDPAKNYFDINLVAFPKVLIENYRDVFLAAGFMPLAFEMEVEAAARALVPKVPEREEQTIIMVDFGRTRTTIVIVSANKPRFTSTIKVAGEDLEKALIKNLPVDRFQAEKIKKERGLVKSKENEKIFNSLLPLISVIKDEIRKCLDYWDSHLEENDDAKGISKILLYGGGSNLIGFPEYLSSELRLPVELGNPWVNILSFEEHIPEIELRESLIYATGLGLALRTL
jgi:type IV pilus assembly protein PilM